MLRPTLDDVMVTVIESFDSIIKPDVTDPYAASIALTISNLLRHVRVRAEREPAALWEDNLDLRQVLGSLGVETPAARDGAVYPSTALLIREAYELRTALDTYVVAHPGDERVRAYLARQLERQRPWMIEAWEGPRR